MGRPVTRIRRSARWTNFSRHDRWRQQHFRHACGRPPMPRSVLALWNEGDLRCELQTGGIHTVRGLLGKSSRRSRTSSI